MLYYKSNQPTNKGKQMKKFLVTYKENRSITVEVEAETQDEAYDVFHNQRDYQESDWEYWGEETHVDEQEGE
jgi:hypothetical protein